MPSKGCPSSKRYQQESSRAVPKDPSLGLGHSIHGLYLPAGLANCIFLLVVVSISRALTKTVWPVQLTQLWFSFNSPPLPPPRAASGAQAAFVQADTQLREEDVGDRCGSTCVCGLVWPNGGGTERGGFLREGVGVEGGGWGSLRCFCLHFSHLEGSLNMGRNQERCVWVGGGGRVGFCSSRLSKWGLCNFQFSAESAGSTGSPVCPPCSSHLFTLATSSTPTDTQIAWPDGYRVLLANLGDSRGLLYRARGGSIGGGAFEESPLGHTKHAKQGSLFATFEWL